MSVRAGLAISSFLNSFIIKIKYMAARQHYSASLTPDTSKQHKSSTATQQLTPFTADVHNSIPHHY
jgi:hypothetical protein